MRHATLRLSQPCAKSWATMTPADAGRHCAACQQVVVDFTRMTDSEVLVFLRHHSQVSCGRFRESQLLRSLPAARQGAGWRRWLGATMALLGLEAVVGSSAWGQLRGSAGPLPARALVADAAPTAPAATQPAGTAPVTAPEPTPETAVFLVIKGTVYNPGGTPRAGIRVSLSTALLSEALLTTTDAQGNFQFSLAQDSLGEGGWLSTHHRPKLWPSYVTATEDLEATRTQPYALHLTRRLKRRTHSMGKFR